MNWVYLILTLATGWWRRWFGAAAVGEPPRANRVPQRVGLAGRGFVDCQIAEKLAENECWSTLGRQLEKPDEIRCSIGRLLGHFGGLHVCRTVIPWALKPAIPWALKPAIPWALMPAIPWALMPVIPWALMPAMPGNLMPAMPGTLMLATSMFAPSMLGTSNPATPVLVFG